MTLIIENVKEEFLPAFRGLSKSINAKLKMSDEKKGLKKKKTIKKEKYYTLENSPAIKKIDKWAKENPELAKQADKELEQEMQGYYNGNCINS